jgi:hypothetical protein
VRGPVLLVAATVVACGAEEVGPPVIEQGTFIALQRDLAPYRQWQRFDFEGAADAVHPKGSRRVYVNRWPAASGEPFAVGTILVKETDGGTTFAMAKRGGRFNAAGAPGWEWFELQPMADGTAAIAWRGIAPPEGEGDGAVSGCSCNGCHGHAGRDGVLSAPLP